jgi:hypothetical protein
MEKFIIRVNKPKKELVDFINSRVVNHKGIVGSGLTIFNLKTNQVAIGWRCNPDNPFYSWANPFDDLSDVILTDEEIENLLKIKY